VFWNEVGVLVHAIAGALDLHENSVMKQASRWSGASQGATILPRRLQKETGLFRADFPLFMSPFQTGLPRAATIA
jgi:hypothetical protein